MPYTAITPLEVAFSDAEAKSVDSLRDAWVEQRAGLVEGGVLSTFNERLTRRWAIETGIIERLYTIDRGTTELLVSHGLDSALIEHGTTDIPAGEIIDILKDHEHAAGYVVDYVAQNRGLTPHFIKSIHSLLTIHQKFVEGEDQFGKKTQVALRAGEWKTMPNNPRRSGGDIHEYCPPVFVNDEIEQLVRYYAKMTENAIPTVIRAAWLHHRFTQIHPFHDGNGRTARALTAMVFVAADCFPIVVHRDVSIR